MRERGSAYSCSIAGCARARLSFFLLGYLHPRLVPPPPIMATAISKPAASQPPKMKRPPPSFTQTGMVNGIKQSPSASSSPALASKRLPGANQPPAVNGIATPTSNGALNRPVNRPRKDIQKPADISNSRPQRATTRNSVAEADRRVTKIPPEPFG